MDVRIEEFIEGKEEIVIRCKKKTNYIDGLIKYINGYHKKMSVIDDGNTVLIDPKEVYYFESVDNIVFVYLKDQVYQIKYTLSELTEKLSQCGFFRCSKSMVININTILSLKSQAGNRIDATLKNGEHIVISRRYAKEFRRILGGGQ